MSYPNACRTRPHPSARHPASPVTWLTWVICPLLATRDTCYQLPRPFTLHSVTPTTPTARRSGPSLTEVLLELGLLCLLEPLTLNTTWPPHPVKSRADLLRHVQWSEGRDPQSDLMTEGRVMPDLTYGPCRAGLKQYSVKS